MKRWMRGVMVLVMGLGVMCGWMGCSRAGEAGGKPVAVATIFAYYDALRAIGGEHVQAVILLPPATSPHEFDPSVNDKRTVNRAKLIVKNGMDLDNWIDKLRVDNGKATVVTVSEGVKAIEGKKEAGDATQAADTGKEEGTKHKDEHKDEHKDKHEHEHAGHAGHGHEHHHGLENPHIWLDPQNQIMAAERIRDALIKIDPAHGADYAKNAAAYIDGIKALDRDFAEAVKTFKTKEFIGFHSAYAYLSQRYGLEQLTSLTDIAEAEPTPAKIREVVELIKTHQLKAVYTENAMPSKAAELIARETKAQRLVLQPLETYDSAENTYVSLMRQNLANLKKGMGE